MARDPELEYWNTGVKPSETTNDDAAVDVPPLEVLRTNLNNIVGALNKSYDDVNAEFQTRVAERAETSGASNYPWYYWAADIHSFVDSRREAIFMNTLNDLRELMKTIDGATATKEAWR